MFGQALVDGDICVNGLIPFKDEESKSVFFKMFILFFSTVRFKGCNCLYKKKKKKKLPLQMQFLC